MRARRLALLLVPPVEPVGLLAGRLIVVDDAVLDDEEGLGLNALIIPADGAERPFLHPVALDVHELRAVAELPEHLLGRRDEARAGVVRLETVYAIELGRMRD